jgi:hypothetical protein
MNMSTSAESGTALHTVVTDQYNGINVLGAARAAGIDAYVVAMDDERYTSTIRLPATPTQIEAYQVVMRTYGQLEREHDKQMEERMSRIWQ